MANTLLDASIGAYTVKLFMLFMQPSKIIGAIKLGATDHIPVVGKLP